MEIGVRDGPRRQDQGNLQQIRMKVPGCGSIHELASGLESSVPLSRRPSSPSAGEKEGQPLLSRAFRAFESAVAAPSLRKTMSALTLSSRNPWAALFWTLSVASIPATTL